MRDPRLGISAAKPASRVGAFSFRVCRAYGGGKLRVPECPGRPVCSNDEIRQAGTLIAVDAGTD